MKGFRLNGVGHNFAMVVITVMGIIIAMLFCSEAVLASGVSSGMDAAEKKIVFLEKDIEYKKVYTHQYLTNGDIENIVEKSSSRYGYEDLKLRSNADGRRSLYNALLQTAESLWNSTSNIPKSDDYYILDDYLLSDYGLTMQEASEVYYTFQNDNPIFYFVSGTILMSGDRLYFVIAKEYADGNERKEINQEIGEFISGFEDELLDQNIYGSLLNIHDELIGNVVYSEELGVSAHNILGSIRYGKGVCETYARTYQLLLNYYGFDNVIVTGTAEGVNHIWNAVRLENNQYYYVDCTYDDVRGNLDYYCVGQNMVSGSHVANGPENVAGAFLYAVPEISNDSFEVPAGRSYSDGILTYDISYSGRATVVGYEGTPVDLVIPEKIDGAIVTQIAGEVFQSCESLETVKIPKTVRKINAYDEEGTFYGCSSLKTVTVPEDSKLNYIGRYSFGSCTALLEIKLPSSLKALGEGAFCGCESLSSIELPEGLEEIGQCGIARTGISSMHIPSTLTRYGNWFASENENLEKITAAEGNPVVKVIDDVMYLNGGWMSADLKSFEDLGEGDELFENVTSKEGWGLFLYPLHKTDKEFTIWEEAIAVSDSCDLRDNKFIEKYHAGMTELNTNMILCEITVSEDSPYYSVVDGYILSKDEKVLVKVPVSWVGQITLPNTVLCVKENAFRNTKCSSVIVPEGVKYIDKYSFSMSALQEVVLPETIEVIGLGAFFEDIYLKKINLPKHLSAIPAHMFESCYSLAEITIPEEVESIGWQAFCYSGLLDIIIPESVSQIDINAFSGSTLKYIEIHGDMVQIGEYAFNACNELRWIIFSGKGGNVSNRAFYNYYEDYCVNIVYPAGDETWENITNQEYPSKPVLNWVPVSCKEHKCEKHFRKPTCEEDGEYYFQCASCGEKYEFDYYNELTDFGKDWRQYQRREMKADGHVVVDGICEICGEHIVQKELSGHLRIDGIPKCGETLTAVVLESNNSGHLRYQWFCDDWEILGATKETYEVGMDDAGLVVSCVVTSSIETGSISASTDSVIARVEGPAAPKGIIAVPASSELAQDGKLVGTTPYMEYATLEDFSNALPCGEGETTGLAAGTYYVRFSEWSYMEPGEAGMWVISDKRLDVKIGHTAAVQNNLALNYKVAINTEGNFTDVKLHIERQVFADESEDFTWETMDLTKYSMDDIGRYVFTFSGIAAAEMGNLIRASVIATKDGVTYESPVDEYSIKTYADRALANYMNSTEDAEQKLVTLLVDMLNYGAQAQIYFKRNTENLVNADLTEELQAKATALPESFTSCKAEGAFGGDATAEVSARTLSLGSSVVLNAFTTYGGSAPGNSVNVVFEYTTIKGKAMKETVARSSFRYDKSKNRYCASLATVAAADFSQPITITVFDGATQISRPYIYSYESYARGVDDSYKQSGDAKIGEILTLMKYMMAYSNGAKAFFQ